MEQRLEQDKEMQTLYTNFMDQYEALQHMSRVQPAGRETRACYLPHNGMLKASSTSTKLRVVFNGFAMTPSHGSLNQHLLVRANLLPPLIDVLTRLRWHRYVFVANVEKMYWHI